MLTKESECVEEGLHHHNGIKGGTEQTRPDQVQFIITGRGEKVVVVVVVMQSLN